MIENDVYKAVSLGDIDLLKKHIPDAKALLECCDDCDTYKTDVMGVIVNNNDTSTLSKILDTYFNENTEENNQLKKKFLLSHKKGDKPKDYHYFRDSFSEYDIAREDFYLNRGLKPKKRLTFKESLFSSFNLAVGSIKREFKKAVEQIKNPKSPLEILKDNILQLQIDFKKNSKKNTNSNSLYSMIRDEYQKASLKKFDYFRPYKERSINDPKGRETMQINGYSEFPKAPFVGNKSEFFLDTYPNIMLETFSEDAHKSDDSYGTREIISGIFYHKDTSFKEQVFKKLNFPDLYFKDYYFTELERFDNNYKDIRENDEFASMYIKNFSGNIVFQNNREPGFHGNGFRREQDYGGYSNGMDIVIRTLISSENTLHHEFTHNTDADFSKMNIFKYCSAAMVANPNASEDRNMAVSDSAKDYSSDAFLVENLARIGETYVNNKHENDPLLQKISELLGVYANNCLNNNPNIRLAMLGNKQLDAGAFNNFYEAMLQKHIVNDKKKCMDGNLPYDHQEEDGRLKIPFVTKEDIDKADEDLQEALKRLCPKGCVDTHKYVEDLLIDIIDKEIITQKEIGKVANASKVKLPYGMQQCNYDQEEPLEIVVANIFNKLKEEQKIEYENLSLDSLDTECYEVESLAYKIDIKMRKSGEVDIEELTEFMKCSYELLAKKNQFIKENFPNCEINSDDINICLPGENITQDFSLIKKRLASVNNENEDIRFNPEIIKDIYESFECDIENADIDYERRDMDGNIHVFAGKKFENFEIYDYIKALRTAQNIYKDLYPDEDLPDNLKFYSLTDDTIKKDQKGNSIVGNVLKEYQTTFKNEYEKQNVPSIEKNGLAIARVKSLLNSRNDNSVVVDNSSDNTKGINITSSRNNDAINNQLNIARNNIR